MVFEDMDSNKDGVVDKEEFMLRLRDLLHFDSQDKEQRTPVYRLGESLYDICDLSGDGVLNAWEVHFCEYLVLSYAFSPQSQTEEDDAPLVASIEAFGGNRAQQLLRRFDVDTSGLLSPAEFSEAARMAFRAFGWSDDRLEDPRIAARIQAAFADADCSGDGLLHFRELQYATLLLYLQAVEHLAGEILWEGDADQNGWLDKSELLELTAMKQSSGNPFQKRLRDSFLVADVDRDGSLNTNEVSMMAAELLGDIKGYF